MANFIISTGQPIGAGAYQPEIEEVYVSYEPNGAITDLTGGVTFKIAFDIPDGVDLFTFKDNGVATRGSLVNGEWVFIDHFDVSYEPDGAITGIMPPNVTFDSVKNEFVVPLDVLTFKFKDDGVAMNCSFVDGEWVFIDHFDVSYEPNGAITDIVPPSVTFDSVKNEFVVPADTSTFTFTDNGVDMRGYFINGEWVFIDHFDVSYEPNGAITGIMPLAVTFDSVKNEFVVPVDIPSFSFNDNGVAMTGSPVDGEWVFALQ